MRFFITGIMINLILLMLLITSIYTWFLQIPWLLEIENIWGQAPLGIFLIIAFAGICILTYFTFIDIPKSIFDSWKGYQQGKSIK